MIADEQRQARPLGAPLRTWHHLLFSVVLIFGIPARADILTGTVVAVADGDTVTVLDSNLESHRIRVAGIDAPEKAQPFGQRAKQSMSALVFGKEVDVQWTKRDRYRRIVGKVRVSGSNCLAARCPKTVDAGLAQITSGMAWWYGKYASEQSADDARQHEESEREARSKRVGLWADANPVPPWEWRKGGW